MPNDSWAPRLLPVGNPPPPQPASVPAASSFELELRALLERLTVERKEDGPRPRYWEFIPERDADRLITKITATPFY